MSDLFGVLLLLLLAAIGWWFINGLQALEIAREAGRRTCEAARLQFLDDTVVSSRVEVSRDAAGQRVLRRHYHFEFSENGQNRFGGDIILLGHKIESIILESYQMRDISDEVEVIDIQ